MVGSQNLTPFMWIFLTCPTFQKILFVKNPNLLINGNPLQLSINPLHQIVLFSDAYYTVLAIKT